MLSVCHRTAPDCWVYGLHWRAEEWRDLKPSLLQQHHLADHQGEVSTGIVRGKGNCQGAVLGASKSSAAFWWFPEAGGGWSLNLVGAVMESQWQEVEMRV